MAKATWVNAGGVWKKVKNVWGNIGGVWKQKVIPKGNIGGTWKNFIEYRYLTDILTKKYTVNETLLSTVVLDGDEENNIVNDDSYFYFLTRDTSNASNIKIIKYDIKSNSIVFQISIVKSNSSRCCIQVDNNCIYVAWEGKLTLYSKQGVKIKDIVLSSISATDSIISLKLFSGSGKYIIGTTSIYHYFNSVGGLITTLNRYDNASIDVTSENLYESTMWNDNGTEKNTVSKYNTALAKLLSKTTATAVNDRRFNTRVKYINSDSKVAVGISDPYASGKLVSYVQLYDLDFNIIKTIDGTGGSLDSNLSITYNNNHIILAYRRIIELYDINTYQLVKTYTLPTDADFKLAKIFDGDLGLVTALVFSNKIEVHSLYNI